MVLLDMGIMFLFLGVPVGRKFSGDKVVTILDLGDNFDVGRESHHQNPQNCRQRLSTRFLN